MKYCKNCGSQLTDNAMFCPQCGTRIENSTPSKDSHLPIWAKVTLGIVFAFTCFCSIALLADGFWFGGIITLCASGAIIAIFMDFIDKKWAWLIALASLFIALFFAAEAGDNETAQDNHTQTEQNKEIEGASSSNSSNEGVSSQTELMQESEADRQAREREKEAKEKKRKEEIMLEYARWCGEQQCTMTKPIEAKKWYIPRFGTPSTEEDFKNFEKFKAEYERALEKGREAARRMDNM